MTNVVANLRDLGISYGVIGEVCGESYTNISNYALRTGDLPQSAIDKLRRAESALAECTGKGVGEIFESHIILTDLEDGGTAWLYLHEMWGNGLISDEELCESINRVGDDVYRLENLARDYAGNTEVSVEDIPSIHHAEPREFMDFRKSLLSH